MRRSSSKSEERKTHSSQTSAPLLVASAPTERCESREWEMSNPGATYRAEDTGSPAESSAGLVQAEGRIFGHEALRADSGLQTAVLPLERTSGVGRILPDGSECQYGVNDPDEDTWPTRRNDSHSCQGKQQVSPRARDQDSVNADTVATSISKASGGMDEAAEPPRPALLAHIEPREARDHRDTHEKVTFSSRSDRRKRVSVSSLKAQDHRQSRFDRPELSTRTALLGQNVGTIGSETGLAALNGHECDERSRPPKRQLTPFGWRLRRRGPTKLETSSTVTSREGHPEAEANDAASRKKRALTLYNQQSPDKVDTVSCALRLTPSPPSSSTGRSLRHSWTSVFTKNAGGRKIPRATTLFALLGRASNSPSPEKPAPKGLGRLSVASDIVWACDESDPDETSTGIPATLVDPSTGKERKNVYVRDEGDATNLLQVQEIPLTTDPYEIRTSKLATFLGLKETPFGSRFGKSLTAMFIASVMILAGMFIAAAVMAQSAVFQQITLMRLAEDLKKFCTAGAKSADAGGCLAAVEKLSHVMDWSADPCSSLDQFVCGHWRRWNQRRRTYKQESTDNLTASIHKSFQHLLRNLNLYGHAEGSMAVFYNSCRWFISRRHERIASAADLMSALGLQRNATTTNESVGMPALLNFVVGTSLRSGLSSVISVTSRAGNIYIDMGQSLRSSLGVANVVPFLRAALSGMGLGDDGLNPLLYVDLDVHSAVENARTLEPFVNVTAGVLGRRGFFGASLVDAVNRALPNGVPVHTVDTVVAARCLSEMQATLAAVAAAKPHVAYIYASLVLVAQVMKYAYVLPHGADLNDHYVTRTCVKITGNRFRALFPHWVTRTLVGRQGLADLQAIRESLRQSFARSATAMELRLNESDLDDVPIMIIGERDVSAWPPTAPAGIAPTDYDHHFLLNVIRASRDAVDTDYDDSAVERLLGGDIVIGEVNHGWTVFVPANFIAADMAYAYSGPEVNFPTLGVWLIAQWIRAAVLKKELRDAALLSRQVPTARPNLDREVVSSPASGGCVTVRARAKSSLDRVTDPQKLELVDVVDDRAECTRQEASKVLGRNVSDVEAEFLFFVNWALDVAFLALEAHRRELAPWSWWKDDRRTWQLFLMRFCQTLCGDEAAADTCRYHALQSQQLAQAFRCDGQLMAGC